MSEGDTCEEPDWYRTDFQEDLDTRLLSWNSGPNTPVSHSYFQPLNWGHLTPPGRNLRPFTNLRCCLSLLLRSRHDTCLLPSCLICHFDKQALAVPDSACSRDVSRGATAADGCSPRAGYHREAICENWTQRQQRPQMKKTLFVHSGLL